MSWDFVNHQLYLPYAWLGGRIRTDVFGAGPQSYQNPLGYFPIYVLIKCGLPAWLIGVLLGAAHALLVWPLDRIGRLFWPTPTPIDLAFRLLSLALCCVAPILLIHVGTVSTDPITNVMVVWSIALTLERLREDDHVAIVTYAGESGLALPSTSGDHKDAILRAVDKLRAGGSTNGAAGIKLAYQVARKGFIPGGTNRVILATDGDFNVGVTSRGALLKLVEEERRSGVFLSVLGVGTDNLKDSTMQTLADHGNGNYNYLDRLEEGRKVLVQQMSGTLVTIAKDVKIQVEFNPATVDSYRLVGYEKRLLRKEDFNDDKIDAGEIGAGHDVTALYEVVPVGQAGGTGTVDPLKYQPSAPDARPVAIPGTHQTALPEMLTVKLRHKAPESDTSERSYEQPLIDRGAPGDYADASDDFRFAAAVASFGMVLRDSSHKGDATLGSALELAQGARGEDPNGYRAGFIELVRHAQLLQEGRRR